MDGITTEAELAKLEVEMKTQHKLDLQAIARVREMMLRKVKSQANGTVSQQKPAKAAVPETLVLIPTDSEMNGVQHRMTSPARDAALAIVGEVTLPLVSRALIAKGQKMHRSSIREVLNRMVQHGELEYKGKGVYLHIKH